MNPVTFATETLNSVRSAGIEALLERHWDEIAHYKDIPLKVRWPVYEAAEQVGKLFIYTARIESALVGYVAYLVDYAPHYADSLQAVQDVLFLAPEHRGNRVGNQLLAFSEDDLRTHSVQVVYQHSKVKHPMDPLLVRRRYEYVDSLWAKRLDRE